MIRDGTTDYLWSGEAIARIAISSSAQYAQGDGASSLRQITDNTGHVAGAQQYDAYGKPKQQSGVQSQATPAWSIGFTGQQMDWESNLVYARARYDDWASGRFLSQDPWFVVPAGSPSQSWYVYANNNPVKWSDPSGLTPICSPANVNDCDTWLEQMLLQAERLTIAGAVAGGIIAGADALRYLLTTMVNQMKKQIERGQAPKSVDRADVGRIPGEKAHVHLERGGEGKEVAINYDGTYKHNSDHYRLTRAEKDWLRKNGWTVPPDQEDSGGGSGGDGSDNGDQNITN